MSQPSSGSSSSTGSKVSARAQLALDGALVLASQVTAEELNAADDGTRIAYRLALHCARILRGQSVGALTPPVPVVTAANVVTAEGLYADWVKWWDSTLLGEIKSELDKQTAKNALWCWEQSKAAWSAIVSAWNAAERGDLGQWVDDNVADAAAIAVEKAARRIKEGAAQAQQTYYAIKGEVFDWSIGLVICLLAYGYAKRN